MTITRIIDGKSYNVTVLEPCVAAGSETAEDWARRAESLTLRRAVDQDGAMRLQSYSSHAKQNDIVREQILSNGWPSY
jgi:hypothetical protein